MQKFAATQHILTNRVCNAIEITGTGFQFEVERDILILVEDGRGVEFGILGTNLRQMIGLLLWQAESFSA